MVQSRSIHILLESSNTGLKKFQGLHKSSKLLKNIESSICIHEFPENVKYDEYMLNTISVDIELYPTKRAIASF